MNVYNKSFFQKMLDTFVSMLSKGIDKLPKNGAWS